MKEILMLGQTYEEEIMLGMMAFLLILSIISLLKISATKRKLNHVVKTVQDYLEAVCEEESANSEAGMEQFSEKDPAVHMGADKKVAKDSKDEEQSRIISAVLQEIFP